MYEPPAFWTGSMITIATVAGLLEDRLLEVVEQERGELRLGLRRRPVVAVRVAHVHDTRDERLEGVRSAAMPLIESAPNVVP